MMSRQAACYWCCHAAVFTLALCILLVPQQLGVDGFSLVAIPPSPAKQFSTLHNHKNHHKPAAVAFIRLDVRRRTTALSAKTNDLLVEKNNLGNVTATTTAAKSVEQPQTAPPVSFDKFLTMQDKRVVVTVQYSGDSGLRPYFLTVAKKLKASHPDVIIERRILAEAAEGGSSEATFEVLVDGKVAVGKGRHSQKQKVARVDMSKTRSVFVSMQALDLAISKARRRRRPNTVYGGGASPPAAAASGGW